MSPKITSTSLSTVAHAKSDAGTKPTPVVPDHELIRRIGEGGYGEVWLARNALGTYRAVKVVYRLSFKDERVYEREFRGIQMFEPISRSNDGLLDILQAGRNDAAGYYYYVMELADTAEPRSGDRVSEAECSAISNQSAGLATRASRGGPLNTDDCSVITSYSPKTLQSEIQRRGRLPPSECVQLALNLTLALGHLHRHGLIHRDIKPANIIFLQDIPKLADIGLVTTFDETCSFVGTEGFIAPEGPTSPRADLFSLGKVLYEISTGKDRKDFPEPATGLGEQADQALDELNAVILKACASDPEQRYQSAEEFHADLALLQSGKSVKHRTRLEKRVALRTRLAAVVAIAAAIALGAYAFQRYQTTEARRLAEENRRLAGEEAAQRNRAEEKGQHLEFQRAHEQFETGQSSLALAYLARGLRHDPVNRVAAERLLSALSHRQYALPKFELAHDGKPVSARFSPDGTRIVTASKDGIARVWETITGKLIFELPHERELADALFSHNSRWILTRDQSGTVQVWDASSGQTLASPISHPGATIAEFSPDDTRTVTGGKDGRVRIWETRTSDLVGAPLEAGAELGSLQDAQFSSELKFSPDGACLVTVTFDRRVAVWDVASGRKLVELPEGYATDISPDGSRLVLATGLEARVCDARSGNAVSRPLPHKFPIRSVRFSPDGQRVVTASNDQTARIWDAESGVPLARSLQHGDGVLYAEFTANGERLMTWSQDRQFRFWNANTGELTGEPTLLDLDRFASAQISPDERWVLVFSGSAVRLWDVRFGAMLPLTIQPEIDFEELHDNFVSAAHFDAQGAKVLTGNSHLVRSPWWGRSYTRIGPCVTRVWSATSGRPVSRPVRHEDSLWACAFSADSRWVVSASEDGLVFVWAAETGDLRTAPLRHEAAVLSACFNRDGRLVATACQDGFVRVWDADSGQVLHCYPQRNDTTPAGSFGQPVFVQFSPDSSLLISCFGRDPRGDEGKETTARIWNLATGAEQAVLPHRGNVRYAAFSPDSGRAVTVEEDGDGARVWDARSGQPITDWLRHNDSVTFAQFSPDGERVVTSSTDRSARIWDSRTGGLLAGPLKHGWEVLTARFSPDGRRVVTASWDQTAQIWDALTGLPISEPIRHWDWVHAAEFSPDGNRILTAMVRQNAQIWEVISPPLPVPKWLPRLAEALGGQRLDDDGNLRRISWDESMKLRAELDSISSTTPLGSWLRWFLADRETRLISPSASVRVAEHLQQRIEDDSLESLTQALQLAPLNPKILSRLGRKVTIARGTRMTQQDRADWLTRLALQLAPEDPSVWWLRADVLEALDRLEESQTVLAKALEMSPDDPNAWMIKAFLLHRSGKSEAAYETYLKTLTLLGEGRYGRSSAEVPYLQEGLREIRALGSLDAKKCADLAAKKKELSAPRNRIEADWLLRKAGMSK